MTHPASTILHALRAFRLALLLALVGVWSSTVFGQDADAQDQPPEVSEEQRAAEERELGAEEDPMVERARRFEEAREEEAREEDAETSSRDQAREREQGADEDQGQVRRAQREAGRSVEEEAGVDLLDDVEGDEPSPEEEALSEEIKEAEAREFTAEEDPLAVERAAREARREAEAEEDAAADAVAEPGDEAPVTPGAPEPSVPISEDDKYASKVEHTPVEGRTGFDIYGSLRVRYREQGAEGGAQLEDGSSRIGTDVELEFKRGAYLFGRYEAGFNLLSEVSDIFNPGENSGENSGDSFFTRLAYVGIDAPVVAAVMGKNWSPYYKVTAFTDRFMGTGGSASGTYNAQTDGGPTGTGRADKTVQTQIRIDFLPQKWFKPFDLNLQVQNGNTIPFSNGIDYGTAVGVSAVMTTQKDFTVGLAYNEAQIPLEDHPELAAIGLQGTARAMTIGTRAFGDRWYAGLLVSRLQNHETTDDGIYFDGWGSEFYGQYQLLDRFWLIGGYNFLEPDSGERLARDYQVRYAVIGARFTFDNFRRMFYANIRWDDSTNADGSKGSNVYTIGIRWDLSRLGWHVKSTAPEPPPAE